MDKLFYKSKTFWTQVLGFLVITLTAILPVEYKEIIMSAEGLIMAILTIVFRCNATDYQGGLKV